MKNGQKQTESHRKPVKLDVRCAWLIACAPMLVLLGSGCTSATVEKPLVQSLGGADEEKQMEFWHQLADQPMTSNDDAMHALLIFTDGSDASADYAARVQALKQKGLLPTSFNQPANQAVDRGTLAVALAKALRLRGGLVMSLFGPSARYATKELEFVQVFPASSPNQTFSGSEFLAVMTRAEEYQQSRAEGEKSRGPDYAPPELELRRTGREPGGSTTQPVAPTQPVEQPPITQPVL